MYLITVQLLTIRVKMISINILEKILISTFEKILFKRPFYSEPKILLHRPYVLFLYLLVCLKNFNDRVRIKKYEEH